MSVVPPEWVVCLGFFLINIKNENMYAKEQKCTQKDTSYVEKGSQLVNAQSCKLRRRSWAISMSLGIEYGANNCTQPV
jgi:hypothetical protein